MNNLCGNLVNHIYDYSIGDDLYLKSKFTDVINHKSYFNVDDIVSDYSSNNRVIHKDLAVDIINCWFYLGYKSLNTI